MISPMATPQKPFFAAHLARPVAGAIGPDADTHLGVLEMQGLQITSRYEYHRELSRLAEMFPAKASGEFTRHDIDRHLVARTVTGRKVSVSTRRKVMSVLSGFFRWATVAGLFPQGDPTQGMRRPPLQEPNPTAWTAEEVARILAVPTTTRNHLLLELLARTGQRQDVIRNLMWSQVDLTPYGSAKPARLLNSASASDDLRAKRGSNMRSPSNVRVRL
jgi:integrase